MITRAVSFTGLVCAVLLGCGVSVAEAQTRLRYQFKEGDSQHYVLLNDMTMEMTLPNQPNPATTKMEQATYTSQTVLGVSADGIAKLKQQMTRMKMKSTTPAQPAAQMNYDSANLKESRGALVGLIDSSMKPLLANAIEMQLDAHGKAHEITISDGFAEGLKKAPGAAMMGDIATAEGLKNSAKQSAIEFPVDPVKIGQTWDQVVEMKSPIGVMAVKKTSKYVGPNSNGLEQIEVKTVVTLTPDEKSATKVAMKNGEGTGLILFDNKAGRLSESTLKQTLDMQITVGTTTIDQKVTTDVVMKIDPNNGKVETKD